MAVTVKLTAPAVVGVPDMAPEELILNPGGKLPVVTLQAMVPTPPLLCKLSEYAVLTTPFGRAAVVIASWGLMVMLRACFTLCGGLPESVAVTVKLDVPALVGVPEMAEPLTVNPAGNVPAVTLQLMAPVPPEAASEAL